MAIDVVARTENIISLCAGAAGLDIGVAVAIEHLGGEPRTVCFVEREFAAAALLAARMQDGDLDDAAIWSDLRTFDGRPWREIVDGIVAGIPRVKTTNATSGLRRRGSSPRSDLDGSTWRTLPGFSDTTGIASDRSYRAWVTQLRKRSSRRRKLALRINGSGSLSWPTPTIPNGGQTTAGNPDVHHKVPLTASALTWPTPRSEDSQEAGSHRGSPDSLKAAMDLWAAPPARSVKGGYSEDALVRADGKDRMDLLDNQAIYWQTPSPPKQASAWPTPTSADHNRESQGYYRGNLTLNGASALFSRPDPQTSTPGGTSSPSGLNSRRQLNAAFVEWLMGWPVGWTSLARSGCGSRGTASYRSLLHTRLSGLVGSVG